MSKFRVLLGLMAILALSVAISAQDAPPEGPGGPDGQGNPQAGPGGPRMRDPFASLRDDKGGVKIDNFLKALADDLKKADADKDGILSTEEQRESPMAQAIFRRGGPGSMPGFGHGPQNPLASATNDKGEIELAKLPEQMPEQIKKELTDADKDKDGFLSKKEQKKIPFLNGQRGGPDSSKRRGK